MERVFRKEDGRLVRIDRRDPSKLYSFTLDAVGECYIELTAAEETQRTDEAVRHQNDSTVVRPTDGDRIRFIMSELGYTEQDVIDFLTGDGLSGFKVTREDS